MNDVEPKVFEVREVGSGLRDRAKQIAIGFLLTAGIAVVSVAPSNANPLTVVPNLDAPGVELTADEIRSGQQIINDMTRGMQNATGRAVCVSFQELNADQEHQAMREMRESPGTPGLVMNGFKVGPTSCNSLPQVRTDVLPSRHAAEVVAFLIKQENEMRSSRQNSPAPGR